MFEGFRICLLFGGLPMGDHPAILGSFSSNGQAPAKEVFEMTAECGGACPNWGIPWFAVFHRNPNSYPAWCRIFQPSTVSFPIVFGYHSPIHQPKKYQPWVPFVFPLVIYHVPWFSSMLFFIEGSARTYPEVRKSQDAAWPWSSRYFSLDFWIVRLL